MTNKLARMYPAKIDELGPLPEMYPNNDFIEGISPSPLRRRDSPMAFEGTLKQVFDELEPVAENPAANAIEQVYWHPSLVVRAIIESSVDGPGRVELINLATELGLSLYAGIPATEQLGTLIEKTDGSGLGETTVRQHHDNHTLLYTKDIYSGVTASHLADIVGEEDPLLVVPICYGGFVPAVRMALQYQRLRPEADTAVYPIRLSRNKKDDQELYLTEDEVKYFGRIAKGRTVVMADDDAFHGLTIEQAIRDSKSLAPRSKVIGLVNGDHRYADELKKQGQIWEFVE